MLQVLRVVIKLVCKTLGISKAEAVLLATGVLRELQVGVGDWSPDQGICVSHCPS